ncbi:hypothetical protein [Streptomyces sp. NPDC090025]|uniref:hypothetical protein n=1 Tax=Streptomyces sp. NPDC090025 TaxID=3365922 RepID=UPI00383565B0
MSTPPQPNTPPFAPVTAHPQSDQVMPGSVKTARVLLFIIGGFQTLAAMMLLFAGLAAQSGSVDTADLEGTAALELILIGAVTLVQAAVAVGLAARFRSGRGGVRIGAIVIGGLIAANGLINLFTGGGLSVPGIALGGLIGVNCRRRNAIAYFNRPRDLRPHFS